MSLRILYEDDDLLFVDKAPGIVVQRGYDADEPVLFELVHARAVLQNETLFLMQRLDRGTSGVIFFSKSADLNARITRAFERKEIRKRYIALCHGVVAGELTIDAPLSRIGPISFGVRDGGKRSVTIARPIASSDAASVVELDLMTGRTHQIRVHMAHAGHPLVGDWLYGERDAVRPMLHSASIDMPHPRSRVPLRVTAELPHDFTEELALRCINVAEVIDHMALSDSNSRLQADTTTNE